MTPRENLLRTLRREPAEYIPLDMDLCESQIAAFHRHHGEGDFREYFQVSHRTRCPILKGPQEQYREFYREELPESTELDSFGVAHSSGSEAAFHMKRIHHPLKGERELSEMAQYPFPEVSADEKNRLQALGDELKQRGLAFACWGGHIWETAWAIRSMEDLMMDMAAGDPCAELLFAGVTRVRCETAKLIAAAGADIIMLGDDIGMQSAPMMSTDFWRTWIKPRLSAVIRSAKQVRPDIIIWYHSCGYIIPFIDELIEAGIQVLNPVQPESMDFTEVHRRWGDRLSFWGTLGTQTTLPFGTPEDVRTAVAKTKDVSGGRGVVIGPTHLVEPEVPWENLEVLREAVLGLSPGE